jgi:hypothetical protein
MADAEIIWIEPPEGMIRALELYGKKALASIYAVAEFIADKMQTEAPQNAPWEDRTGNARSGLFSDVEMEAAEAIVTIYLSHGHTIFYGKFLELAHGGRYSIIMPTIEANLPELMKLLNDLFSS